MADLFEILESPTTSDEKTIIQDRMKDARTHYYNGTPIMSDAEYDILEIRLRELDPSNPILDAVGVEAPQQGTWPKVSHTIPMGSLDKVMPDDKVAGSKVAPGIKAWWEKTELKMRG